MENAKFFNLINIWYSISFKNILISLYTIKIKINLCQIIKVNIYSNSVNCWLYPLVLRILIFLSLFGRNLDAHSISWSAASPDSSRGSHRSATLSNPQYLTPHHHTSSACAPWLSSGHYWSPLVLITLLDAILLIEGQSWLHLIQHFLVFLHYLQSFVNVARQVHFLNLRLVIVKVPQMMWLVAILGAICALMMAQLTLRVVFWQSEVTWCLIEIV